MPKKVVWPAREPKTSGLHDIYIYIYVSNAGLHNVYDSVAVAPIAVLQYPFMGNDG
jgi:hypothetical protein